MDQNIDQLIAEAEALAKSGDLENAEYKYLEALKADPKSASAHYGLGTIAMQCGQFEHALECLTRAGSLEPEAVDIAYNLAHCYFHLGDSRQAALQLQRASTFCKDDPVFCSLIADFFVRLAEPDAAIQLLSRLQVLTPNDQIILARAHAGKTHWRESASILQRLRAELPNEPKIANDLAVAAGKLRDYDTAISAFEHYLTLVTPSAIDYLRFADLLLMAQKTARCRQAITLALDKGESSAEVFVLRAKVNRLAGDYTAANIALDEALSRSASDGQAWTLRAELVPDEDLVKHIQTLSTQLELVDELDLHNNALLCYALAEMQDRHSQFEQAAKSMFKANTAQAQVLESRGEDYKPEVTVAMVDRLISQYDQGFFSTISDGVIHKPNSELIPMTIQPIFIVGMPRSGTTLVERIIGQNSDVYNGGEQEAMEFMAADLNRRIRSGRLPSVDKISDQQWAELRQSYIDKLPINSKPIITDKLPHNFRHVGLILKLFPQAKVVQMHRNIQDVSLSIYSKAFSAGHNYANTWFGLEHFYSECERLMVHWSSMNSPRILDLSYEDLVESPEQYAKQLVEFCGFEWSDWYLNFHQSVNSSFTFSEMQVRQPIANKRVGRWQQYSPYFPELMEMSSTIE